jgi:hypothetical protein
VNASGVKGRKDEEHKYNLFELFEDGTHGHYLKSTLRPRDWLSGVFRGKPEGKKTEGEPSDQQLTDTLVEKYVKCQEIVGMARSAWSGFRIRLIGITRPSPFTVSGAAKPFRRLRVAHATLPSIGLPRVQRIRMISGRNERRKFISI